LLLFIFFNVAVYAEEGSGNIEQQKVVSIVKEAEKYIKKNGKEKAIDEFKKSFSNIFVINFDGMVLVSPAHPEMIGTNQINYKDSRGVLVVQEEIDKARAGGGWLKGRLRENLQTGKCECRKIYVLPMQENYLIGSWYYYPADKKRNCLI